MEVETWHGQFDTFFQMMAHRSAGCNGGIRGSRLAAVMIHGWIAESTCDDRM